METGIGIVGCGTISGAYLRNLARAPGARVVALADLDMERARKRAQEFDVPLVLTPEELIEHEDVSLVVDLTIPAAHFDVNRRALEAGKRLYCEKPLAATAAQAHELLALAERNGLAFGGAPDTFLGVGLQTARVALDEGLIGRPFGAVAHMVTRGPESWHHDPGFLFQPGAGPLLDMGPYYVTAMVTSFGPVASVSAEGGRTWSERTIAKGPLAGTSFPVAVDTHVTLLLRFASGFLATLLTTFDVSASRLPRFEVFGEDGTLSLPDPNTFAGPVQVATSRDDPWRDVTSVPGFVHDARGIGALDLLAASREGRAPRASGALAAHVLDVLEGGLDAMRTGRRIDIESRPERPAPLTPADLEALGWKPEVHA